MNPTVTIKGNRITIEVDLQEPTPSKSGKTLVIASTRGNVQTKTVHNGKPVYIGVNAYVKP
jgi:hypothetical protein